MEIRERYRIRRFWYKYNRGIGKGFRERKMSPEITNILKDIRTKNIATVRKKGPRKPLDPGALSIAREKTTSLTSSINGS